MPTNSKSHIKAILNEDALPVPTPDAMRKINKVFTSLLNTPSDGEMSAARNLLVTLMEREGWDIKNNAMVAIHWDYFRHWERDLVRINEQGQECRDRCAELAAQLALIDRATRTAVKAEYKRERRDVAAPLKETIADLRQIVDQRDAEIAQLRLSDNETETTKLRSALADAHRQLAEADAGKDKNKPDQLQAEKKRADRAEAEIVKLRRDLEVATARAIVAEDELWDGPSPNLHEQLATETALVDKLKDQLDEQERAVVVARDDLVRDRLTLQGFLIKANDRAKQTEADLAQLRAQQADTESIGPPDQHLVDQLQDQLDAAERRITEVTEQAARAEDRAKAAKNEMFETRRVLHVRDDVRQCKRLKRELRQIAEGYPMIIELHEQLAEAEDRIIEVTERAARAETRLVDLVDQHHQHRRSFRIRLRVKEYKVPDQPDLFASCMSARALADALAGTAGLGCQPSPAEQVGGDGCLGIGNIAGAIESLDAHDPRVGDQHA